MQYKLEGGDAVRDGVLYGWTGDLCLACSGTGEDNEARWCPDCHGTGEVWGRKSKQPADAPWCFLEPADLDLILGVGVCPDCAGSGVGGDFDVCPNCAGTGAARSSDVACHA